MVQAVLRFLANVAGPAGTLLVLDDLQWASPDALELLTVLARSASEVPLRMIGAYRHTEVGPQHPLASMLAYLAQVSLAEHYTLGPLRPEEARQLVAGLLADLAGAGPEQQRVLQRAGGVPFFLVNCARVLRAGAGAASLWDLAQSVRQRVGALPDVAQELLGVAAVVGRVVPRRVLAAAATGEESAQLVAEEAACGAQLLARRDPRGHRGEAGGGTAVGAAPAHRRGVGSAAG
jgi:predicted ATPase